MGTTYGMFGGNMTTEEIVESFRKGREFRESAGRMTPTKEQLDNLRRLLEPECITDGYSFDDVKFWNLPDGHYMRGPNNKYQELDEGNCHCKREDYTCKYHGKPFPGSVARAEPPGYLEDIYLTEDGLWWWGDPDERDRGPGWLKQDFS